MILYNDLALDSSYYSSYNESSLENCRLNCSNDAKCYAVSFNPYYGCYFYSQNFTFKKYIGWKAYSTVSLNADNSTFIRGLLLY